MKLNRRTKEKSPWKTHWEVLEGRGGSSVCCICQKPLKSKRRYIGVHPISGEPLWRDESCSPGSPNWITLFNGYVNKNINRIREGGLYGQKLQGRKGDDGGGLEDCL